MLNCFKAYDVRGKVPEELDEDMAYRIGRAYAAVLTPNKVIMGYDIRLTSPGLANAITKGLNDSGVDTYDIGLCGTEEVYFATFFHQMDGGIMVTASHNPVEYNGIKFVGKGAVPLSSDTDLAKIEQFAEANDFPPVNSTGKNITLESRNDFINHLLTYINPKNLAPLKIVVDPGNGGAGLVLEKLKKQLPFEFIEINFQPDGNFPNGVPNPLLPENRQSIIAALQEHNADLGIAWDGDFDRCFLFDENGDYIEGYYIVGLLATAFLQKHPGEKIVHDPRLTWNTIDLVEKNGGTAIQSKTGHAFIKASMRRENAVYGGEMSGHHYFKNFAYCDSGMIPWLLVTEMISTSKKPLSHWVGASMQAYPCSGEINFTVADTKASIAVIKSQYEAEAIKIDDIDGLSMEFPDYRFNLRGSNTEPVLRLNVESRANAELMQEKTQALANLIKTL